MVSGQEVPALPPDISLPANIAEEVYAPSNIVTEDSTLSAPHPRDLIWVWFRDDASQPQRQQAIAAVNGHVVGGFRYRPGGVYYVRIKHDGKPGVLRKAIARLKALPQVVTVTPDLNLTVGPKREPIKD